MAHQKNKSQVIFEAMVREQLQQTVAAFIKKYGSPTRRPSSTSSTIWKPVFYAFPKAYWNTIHTTNVIERLFKEVKHRLHRMAAAFLTEGSSLLLFYTVIRSLHFHKLTMSASSIKQLNAEILQSPRLP